MSVSYSVKSWLGFMAIIVVVFMTIIDWRYYGDNSLAVLKAITDDVFYDGNYEAFYENNC